jgi:hypothetical protein
MKGAIMPADQPSKPVTAWTEYIERYLPEDAHQLELLRELDYSTLGESIGRRAIERAVAQLTGTIPLED